MNADRRAALVVGALFIVATVAALASTPLTASTTQADYLTSVASNANQVKAGVLLELAAAISVALIPAFLFPVLRRFDEGIALGYQAIRILEAFVQAVGALGALLLLSLSQKYVETANPTTSAFQASGAPIQGIATWTFVLDPIIFGVGALLFYSLLFRTRLVPRWLSGWGLLGGVLILAAGLDGMFVSFPFALAVPIAVQEIALALWLILKGFRMPFHDPEGNGAAKATA